MNQKGATSGKPEFIGHPIVFEKVNDHIDNGTVEDFLERLNAVLNSCSLNAHELRKLHWKCVIILLSKKYPYAKDVCRRVSSLRKQLNCNHHVTDALNTRLQ